MYCLLCERPLYCPHLPTTLSDLHSPQVHTYVISWIAHLYFLLLTSPRKNISISGSHRQAVTQRACLVFLLRSLTLQDGTAVSHLGWQRERAVVGVQYAFIILLAFSSYSCVFLLLTILRYFEIFLDLFLFSSLSLLPNLLSFINIIF